MAHPPEQVRLVLGSGVFDTKWYEAQARTTFADSAGAVRHYLGLGRRSGWSPHPLFVPAYFRPQRWDRDSVDPLVMRRFRSRRTRAATPRLS